MTIRILACRPFAGVWRVIVFVGLLIAGAGVSPAFAQQGQTTDRFTLDVAGLVAWLSSDLRVDFSDSRTGSDVSVEPTLGLDKRGRVQFGFNGPRVYVQIGG